MEEFLRFVLGELVEHPEELVISRADSGDKTVFHVAARKSDIPKIIGKGGYTIQAIRALLDASAKKRGHTALLEIIE
ncbi:MAG: KH domain-containing protein [Terrimicrobiaceae bacterium]|nr:KH domain-containing protein [Terrimicrobiaceae bacterium]